jgi:large conductance mechanosensitive channel
MKIVQEFKEFAMKGNVLDLAVGVIIGGAFGKIVTSFVNDILMPPLGFLLGGINFSDLKIILKKEVGELPAITFNYGNFIQATIDFLIIAFAIFMFVKMINKFRKKEEAKPEPKKVSNEELLLTEIRDLLKNKQ